MFESAEDGTAQDIQAVCDSIEDGVEVIEIGRATSREREKISVDAVT